MTSSSSLCYQEVRRSYDACSQLLRLLIDRHARCRRQSAAADDKTTMTTTAIKSAAAWTMERYCWAWNTVNTRSVGVAGLSVGRSPPPVFAKCLPALYEHTMLL